MPFLFRVSILTRPVSRVQQPPSAWGFITQSGFNPHPAREPSATGVVFGNEGAIVVFQSSPGP